jgi:hypothetical protein
MQRWAAHQQLDSLSEPVLCPLRKHLSRAYCGASALVMRMFNIIGHEIPSFRLLRRSRGYAWKTDVLNDLSPLSVHSPFFYSCLL